MQNREMASKYLSILDQDEDEFTFQTFDDTKKKTPSLTRILHGSLNELWDVLVSLNNRGAGVYVTVNKTDLKGRKKANIKAIRTIYFENDNQIPISTVPIKSSMLVSTSKGKGHMYYLLDKHESIKDDVDDKWQHIMEYLISLGSDPNAKDITRVLRVPGFFNQKEDCGNLVTLVKHNGIRYSWESLLQLKEYSEKKQKDLLAEIPDKRRMLEAGKIYAALYCIDPDDDYDIWVKVGMAIHYESGGGKAGYKLFHTWSKRGKKYNADDWPSKWDSFSQDSNNPVTKGTLFRIAKANGWGGDYSLERNGAKYIHLERFYKFTEVNKRHGMILDSKKVNVVRRRVNGDNKLEHQFTPLGEYDKFYNPFPVPVIKELAGGPVVRLSSCMKEWSYWEKARKYTDWCFKPDPSIRYDKNQSKHLPDETILNTYLGVFNPGNPGNWENYKSHLFDVICNGDQEGYEYLIKWLARMFQKPGQPGETLLVFKSRQGSGKNMAFDPILKAWGRYGAMISHYDSLTGNFNNLVAKAIFIVLNEAVWAANKKARSILKSMITDQTVEYRRKFHDSKIINNCSHIITMSNEEEPVPAELGDRRYVIYEVNESRIGDFKYFKNLSKKINGGEGDAFIYYLRNLDISDFNPRIMPDVGSDIKNTIIVENFDDVVTQFVYELLENDFDYSLIGFEPIAEYEGGGKAYGKNEVYESLESYIERHKSRRFKLPTKTSFGIKLHNLLGSGIKSKKIRTESGFIWAYKFEDIFTLRTLFDKINRSNFFKYDDMLN